MTSSQSCHMSHLLVFLDSQLGVGFRPASVTSTVNIFHQTPPTGLSYVRFCTYLMKFLLRWIQWHRRWGAVLLRKAGVLDWLLYTHCLAGMVFPLIPFCCRKLRHCNELLGRRLREQISQISRERSWVQYWISSLQGVKVGVTECLLSSQSGGWAASQWTSPQCRSHGIGLQFLVWAAKWNVNIYSFGEANLNLHKIRNKERFFFPLENFLFSAQGRQETRGIYTWLDCMLSHRALWMCCGCWPSSCSDFYLLLSTQHLLCFEVNVFKEPRGMFATQEVCGHTQGPVEAKELRIQNQV